MASEVSPFLGFTHELLHRSTVEISSLGRGHCRAGRYLGRGADQPLLDLVQADVPRLPDFVHRLRVGNELPPRLLQSLVQLRIVLKWYGTDFAHCLGQTLCEFPFRLDAPVSVHNQIAKPGALQTGPPTSIAALFSATNSTLFQLHSRTRSGWLWSAICRCPAGPR